MEGFFPVLIEHTRDLNARERLQCYSRLLARTAETIPIKAEQGEDANAEDATR